MAFALWAAATCGCVTLIVHLLSIAIAIARCRRPGRHLQPPPDAPPITVIRPVCGIETFAQATLQSTFALDYPRYEVLFCVASSRDPVIAMVDRLIAAHPHIQASLLIGDQRISANPKLNNMVKGWHAAAHDLIVVADSNLLMPPDYLQRLLAAWRPDTGMVSAPPVGSHPQGFWAAMECAFLNTYQLRWQYVADTIGIGFAQGKTLFYRRSTIDAAGGLRALGAESAEDAASTKLMRSAGLRVRLVDAPFEQPLGMRTRSEVWSRQVRWARLRRDSFPALYTLEIAAGSLPPLIVVALVAFASGYPVLLTIAGFLTLWYGAELLLALIAGWHVSPATPLQAMLRDAMLPLLWIEGIRSGGFVWRGNAMTLNPGPLDPAAPNS